jgi:hypothetical protein
VVTAVASTAVVVLVTFTTISSVRAYFPDPRTERITQALSAPTLAAARAAPRPIAVRAAGGLLAGAVVDWMLLALSRHGIESGADPLFQYAVGANHVLGTGTERSVAIVAANEQIDQFANDPRYRLIALTDELAPADRKYMTDLGTQIGNLDPYARLTWAKQHPVEGKRLIRLSAKSDRVAIFLATPPPAP